MLLFFVFNHLHNGCCVSLCLRHAEIVTSKGYRPAGGYRWFQRGWCLHLIMSYHVSQIRLFSYWTKVFFLFILNLSTLLTFSSYYDTQYWVLSSSTPGRAISLKLRISFHQVWHSYLLIYKVHWDSRDKRRW